MGRETRPYELRDFINPDQAKKAIEMSPEIQQEVIRFLLSFEAICRKYDEQGTLDALELLREDFLENYSNFLKSQPIYTEQLEVMHYTPDPILKKVLDGKRTINVPEKLLERNPEIKQAGLELLLCFWKIYETSQKDEILEALRVVVGRYVERYPDSIESQPKDGQQSSLRDKKIEILTGIFNVERVSDIRGEK